MLRYLGEVGAFEALRREQQELLIAFRECEGHVVSSI